MTISFKIEIECPRCCHMQTVTESEYEQRYYTCPECLDLVVILVEDDNE